MAKFSKVHFSKPIISNLRCMIHWWGLFRDILSFLHVNCSKILNMEELNIIRILEIHGAFNKFPDIFVQAFKSGVDS